MEQSTNTATRPTPRGKSRSGGSDGKRKKKKGFSSDSFYNAIKNLGSGPVDKVRDSCSSMIRMTAAAIIAHRFSWLLAGDCAWHRGG